MDKYTILAEVASDSDPRKTYRVSCDNKTGQLACACKGWTRHFPRKDCRHIAYFKMGTNAGVTRSIDGDLYLEALAALRAA